MKPPVQIILPEPVKLTVAGGARVRVAGQERPLVERVVSRLVLTVRVDSLRREIRACLSPLPGGLVLYGAADFTAAAGDTDEDHAARVLEILGADPAGVLQAMIDGREMPEPPQRVPREVANWRIKAVLSGRGLLVAAEAALESLPEPQRTIAALAWNGDAKLSRTSPAVAFIAATIGMTAAQIDQAFIAAEALVI